MKHQLENTFQLHMMYHTTFVLLDYYNYQQSITYMTFALVHFGIAQLDNQQRYQMHSHIFQQQQVYIMSLLPLSYKYLRCKPCTMFDLVHFDMYQLHKEWLLWMYLHTFQ